MRVGPLASGVCLLVVSMAAPAAAQEKGNVAVSYSVLHDSEISETFPTGWVFSGTANLGPMFAVVGEVGGNYKTVSLLGTDVNLRVHSFLGGLRFRNETLNAAPFAQVLVGAANASASLLGVGDNSTGLAIQPGGGVDFRVTRHVGVRVQGDFRMIRSEGETGNEFRFAVGTVFGFGGR